MKRVLTAVALVPLVAYVVLWSPYWALTGVVLLVATLCYREYDAIAGAYGFGAPGPLGYGAGALLLLWPGDTWLLLTGLALLALAMAMRADDLAKSLPRAALLIAGVVYVYYTWRCALFLRHDQLNAHWLMYALLLNWAGDAGAYYVGKNFGRHKLAPRVSPAKSWEGSAASVVTAVLVAGAYLVHFVDGVSIPHAIALTVVANAAGQFGDLAESAMKRGAHVKDSGALLPGHGGMLDRVDSTLFALPVICWYLLEIH